jgi:rubrerythrin
MILSIWITIIAIVVAYVIYKQGAGYKKKLEDDRKDFNKKIAEFYNQQTEILNKQKEAIEKQTITLATNQKVNQGLDAEIKRKIDDAKNQLKSAGEKEKSKIEESIAKLSEDRLRLHYSSPVDTFTIDNPMFNLNYPGGLSNFHQCSKCHFGFLVNSPQTPLYSIGLGTSQGVKCPVCGNIDKL